MRVASVECPARSAATVSPLLPHTCSCCGPVVSATCLPSRCGGARCPRAAACWTSFSASVPPSDGRLMETCARWAEGRWAALGRLLGCAGIWLKKIKSGDTHVQH